MTWRGQLSGLCILELDCHSVKSSMDFVPTLSFTRCMLFDISHPLFVDDISLNIAYDKLT